MSRVSVEPRPRAPGIQAGPDDERNEGSRHRRVKTTPLAILALVGLISVLIGGELAGAGVRAQIDARLRADGAGANSGLVSIESVQLALVRELTYTSGVADALEARNPTKLNSLVTPLQANSGVPMVDVVYPNGQVVFAVRSQGAPKPVASRKGLHAIAASISDAGGRTGGRSSEIAVLQRQPVLLTIGPLVYGTTAIGVVLVMTPLADVLGQLASETNVTLTAYNAAGTPIATTAKTTPAPLASASAASLFAGRSVLVRETGSARETLGRLIVDHRAGAVLGVSMGNDSIVTELVVDLVAGLGLLVVIVFTTRSWRRREHGDDIDESEI